MAGSEITGGERRERLKYLTLDSHHLIDYCIQMGSNEGHFIVSSIVTDKVTSQCPQTTTFEERGEPTRGLGPSAAYQSNNALLLENNNLKQNDN